MTALPTSTPTASPFKPRAALQSESLRRMGAKQWRLLRSAVLFVVSLGVVLLVSMYNRDALAMQADEARMKHWQTRFSAIRVTNELAPIVLPLPPGQPPALLDAYVYTRWFDLVALNRGGTAVVYRRAPLRFFLRPAGRHVLLFDGREFRIEWLDEAKFREQAAAYGIETPGVARGTRSG